MACTADGGRRDVLHRAVKCVHKAHFEGKVWDSFGNSGNLAYRYRYYVYKQNTLSAHWWGVGVGGILNSTAGNTD